MDLEAGGAGEGEEFAEPVVLHRKVGGGEVGLAAGIDFGQHGADAGGAHEVEALFPLVRRAAGVGGNPDPVLGGAGLGGEGQRSGLEERAAREAHLHIVCLGEAGSHVG